MFRKSYNRAVLSIRIDTVTPLLIRAGDSGLDPTAADITCVRTRHGRHGETVYIPGSSLKGVLRTAVEASIRGRTMNSDWLATPERGAACENPLETQRDAQKSCSGRWHDDRNNPRTSAEIHKGHCLACRLFGSLAIKGRGSVRDLFPWSNDNRDSDNTNRANRLELRHGVAIDRVTGAAKGSAKFDQEVVPAGVSFWGDIALVNYQVWQLGLLATAFEQFNLGTAQLGSSTSRGMGVVSIHVERMVHEQASHESQPCGVGMLATADEREQYGFTHESDRLPDTSSLPIGLALRFQVSEPEPIRAWMDAGLDSLRLLPWMAP